MSDYTAFKELEARGWADPRRAADYVDLFAQASDRTIGPLLDAVSAKVGHDVLDLCCGQGNVAEALAASECKATGADFSPAMLTLARSRVPAATFVGADAQLLPFPDARFDAVVSNLGICHIPDQLQALREARRVLRPGGRFAMTVWCGPDQGAGFELLYRIIKTHGSPNVAMPRGPDFHLFANRESAHALLTAAEFSDIKFSTIESGWEFDTPEGFVTMFARATVRAAELLSRQAPEHLNAIREAAAREVRKRFPKDRRWYVPAPAALVSAKA